MFNFSFTVLMHIILINETVISVSRILKNSAIIIIALSALALLVFLFYPKPAAPNKLLINVGKEVTVTSSSDKIVLGALNTQSEHKKRITLYYFPRLLNVGGENSRSVIGEIIIREHQSVKSEVMEETSNINLDDEESGLQKINDNKLILVVGNKVKGLVNLNSSQHGLISGDVYYHPVLRDEYAPFYVHLIHYENEKLGTELFAKELIGIAHELSELIEVKFN